ncbi:hypothetical protein BU25DRAFT_217087 [Macroventuria anomochaeta]|uniref:Uncharacterized protein n=1 Tax=Macroventuria anomochaeta TaxID=301207 RepID=A0ACB6RJV5_9PLEO|nr:uncharacterized protein BU25DRAFT_217087 [Macroventuria anomochaeta]KAF2622181.1 hypothetical protein BU25DRAFT_217087 [Macroventuria anomochaeta]
MKLATALCIISFANAVPSQMTPKMSALPTQSHMAGGSLMAMVTLRACQSSQGSPQEVLESLQVEHQLQFQLVATALLLHLSQRELEVDLLEVNPRADTLLRHPLAVALLPLLQRQLPLEVDPQVVTQLRPQLLASPRLLPASRHLLAVTLLLLLAGHHLLVVIPPLLSASQPRLLASLLPLRLLLPSWETIRLFFEPSCQQVKSYRF